MSLTTCYHVTSREVAEIILSEGLAGGWGDNGFGVYLFDDLAAAEEYAAAGGWDGTARSTVILQIEAPDADLLAIEIHPEWPNPEAYEHVLRHPMAEEDDEARWMPQMCILQDEPEEPEP